MLTATIKHDVAKGQAVPETLRLRTGLGLLQGENTPAKEQPDEKHSQAFGLNKATGSSATSRPAGFRGGTALVLQRGKDRFKKPWPQAEFDGSGRTIK